MNRRLRTYPDLETLSRAAAGELEQTVTSGDAPSVILSGGSTPRRLFELLGTEWLHLIPWPRIHFFWSDERLVPSTDEANNYRLAADLFIDRVPVLRSHLHPIPVDRDSARAAEAYKSTVLDYFRRRGRSEFDLALLGIGGDGHTASLFPDSPLESEEWVEPVVGPPYRPPRERVSLTLRALCSARRVLFLVSGREKRAVLDRILSGKGETLPAARVSGTEDTIFMTDVEASPTPRH